MEAQMVLGVRQVGSLGSDPAPVLGPPGLARWHLHQAWNSTEQLLLHGGVAGEGAEWHPILTAEGLRHRHSLLSHTPPIQAPA